LDDIDRIEILRGSNSAAYGARAFLGVVNIISRDVRETAGVGAKVTGGENGVADVGARLGWGDETLMNRISVDTRGDDGLRKVFPQKALQESAAGTNRISRVNFSSHLANGRLGDVDVRAGAVEIAAIRGTTGVSNEGNAERLRFMGQQFLQLDWKRSLSDNQDIAVTASHTHGFNRDSFPYLSYNAGANYYGVPIAFHADELNSALSFQYTTRHTQALRTVWGSEIRSEQVISRNSFDLREQVSAQFLRLFGGTEWRVLPSVVLNVGALAEDSDLGGNTFAPRWMLNWHVAEGHTLRAGVSTAFRPPSAFEKYGDVKYYDINGLNPLPYVKSSGNVTSEKLVSQELGYSLNLTGGVAGDLRVFNEKVINGIGNISAGFGPKGDFGNGDDFTINGAELQLSWKPASSTQLFFNQTWTQIQVDSLAFPLETPKVGVPSLMWFKIAQGAPKYAASLTVMHGLSNGINLSLMHQRAEEYGLSGDPSRLFSMGRTDIRVAKEFKRGASKTELAFTLQNLDVPYIEGDKKFFFDRRLLVSLQFEY
jgi:iron complex outermembrane receptor protein